MWLLVAMRAEGRRGFSNGGDRPRARAAPVVATDHGRLFQQRNVAERACVRWCTSGAATIAKRRSKGDGPAGADRERRVPFGMVVVAAARPIDRNIQAMHQSPH